MVRFAFISQGRLYVQNAQEPREVKSRFGEKIRERAVALHERNAWKREGTGARFMGMWGRGGETHDPGEMPIHVTGLASGLAPGELLYTLETPDICGFLRVEDFGADEQRLWHSNETHIRDLHVHPGEKRVTCSIHYGSGGSNIGLMGADGSGLGEVTEGDSLDQAPRWVPGSASEVVFQSAGIGRSNDGFAMGLGPYHVQKLNIESGCVETLAEDDTHDLLAPQCDAQGRLHFIRRPYEAGHRRPWWKTALDFLLFPFRLLYAVFQFLNFFTIRYTGKPLTNSNGAVGRPMDLKEMMIWGNVINAEKAARAGNKDEAPDLVPSSWELVRREADGSETVLARSVLSYDLCGDGSIVYTNGSAVSLRSAEGKVTRLAKHHFIEQVVALGA